MMSDQWKLFTGGTLLKSLTPCQIGDRFCFTADHIKNSDLSSKTLKLVLYENLKISTDPPEFPVFIMLKHNGIFI